MRRPIWHARRATENFNLTTFYHKKNPYTDQTTLIIPSSAIKFNSLVSCV